MTTKGKKQASLTKNILIDINIAQTKNSRQSRFHWSEQSRSSVTKNCLKESLQDNKRHKTCLTDQNTSSTSWAQIKQWQANTNLTGQKSLKKSRSSIKTCFERIMSCNKRQNKTCLTDQNILNAMSINQTITSRQTQASMVRKFSKSRSSIKTFFERNM